MHDANGATLHLTLQGGDFHKRCSALIAVIAMSKGWHVRNTYASGSEGWNPDIVIEKEGSFKHGPSKVGTVTVYAIEVIDTSDQLPKWRERNYRMPDILTFHVAGKTLDEVAEDAGRRIP